MMLKLEAKSRQIFPFLEIVNEQSKKEVREEEEIVQELRIYLISVDCIP
jgi:hypothetical protein